MLQLAHFLVGWHRSDRVGRALREAAVVMSFGEAVPSPPSSMPPRRPPSRTRHRGLPVPARLGACPRRATTCPHAHGPAAPSCPPAAAAYAAPAATHRAISHGATLQPGGGALSLVTRPPPAHSSSVLSRFLLANDTGIAP